MLRRRCRSGWGRPCGRVMCCAVCLCCCPTAWPPTLTLNEVGLTAAVAYLRVIVNGRTGTRGGRSTARRAVHTGLFLPIGAAAAASWQAAAGIRRCRFCCCGCCSVSWRHRWPLFTPLFTIRPNVRCALKSYVKVERSRHCCLCCESATVRRLLLEVAAVVYVVLLPGSRSTSLPELLVRQPCFTAFCGRNARCACTHDRWASSDLDWR